MDYQVWTKDEYEDKYTKVDCGDLPAAKREIDAAYKDGKDPILTVEVPYSLAIKIEEPGSGDSKRKVDAKKKETKEKEASGSEASQGKAAADKDPRAEGKGKV